MGRRNRSVSTLYPQEKEGRVKDANKELRAENRQLRKKVKRLEENLRTLKRGFNKNADYIDKKLADKSLEEVLSIVNNFDYKETEKGREKMAKQNNDRIFMSPKCPECGKVEKEGFSTFDYVKFVVQTCKCGFRTKVDRGEGIERG